MSTSEDSSSLTSLRLANSPNGLDLRRIGAHPDYWYPVAWSDELKPGKVLGGASPASPSRFIGARAARCLRWRIAARTGRCRCTSAW